MQSIQKDRNKKYLHQGHRERVRQRYKKDKGFGSFADHELLEFLLFYCYPRQNTNEIAHRMLNTYGSLPKLFEANPIDIMNDCNVTERTAVFISSIPSLCQRYFTARWEAKRPLDNTEAMGEFAINLPIGKSNECIYVVCLDVQGQLLHVEMLEEGSLSSVTIYPRKVLETVIRHKASYVFLAHNHPSGDIKPSKKDKNTTLEIAKALHPIGVTVRDHIIASGGKFFSFDKEGLHVELGCAL